MSCSIIIVTWNGLNWLTSFLPSVVASASDDTEIIIADNASTDGTYEWVKATFPMVTVHSFERNYGYCAGNNRAAKLASGDILIFLNNDVEVTSCWLQPMLDAFQADCNLGATQPKLLSHNDKNRFEYAGAAGGMIDQYGYPYCLGRVFDTCEIDSGQYDNRGESIFWASGAAIAVRKSLFFEAGGFDEDFQFHMEEIDLCWKIRRMGYRISCVTESVVYHVGGGSLDNGSAKKLSFNIRNNLAMLYKHLPSGKLIKVFGIRTILDIIAAARELLKGKVRHAWAIVSAHFQFWLNIKKAHRKRTELLTKRVPFRTDGMTQILLPWQYFVLKRKTAQILLQEGCKV